MLETIERGDTARLMLQHIERYWTESVELDRTLSLVIIDIDHFKRFDKAYGKQAADECIKSLAGVMRKNLRSDSDVAMRYGHDCFCVMLPHTPSEHARQVAERLRQSLFSLRLPHLDNQTMQHLTVSCGVASIESVTIPQPEMVIKLADNALHLAKVAGRNRTVSMSSQLH